MVKIHEGIDELPAILKIEDISAVLQTSRRMVDELTKRKVLPSFKIGNQVYISKQDFINWLKPNNIMLYGT